MHELVDPFARLIEDACPPAAIRKVEEGGDWRPMWDAIAQSGFLDALVAEDAGGAGLSLGDVGPLIEIIGRHAVPLPVAETMVARALLAAAGMDAPEGPIALVTGPNPSILAGVAEHGLSGDPAAPVLSPLGDVAPTGVAYNRDAAIANGRDDGLRPVAAVVRALLIAGAAGRVLEMTVAYANERVQFGKPIGKQQALQQSLAVMAEQAVAARIAAAIGARGGLFPTLNEAAVAKHGASLAATQIATSAHAVHGAIGVSEEYDLQLITRRLHGWRLADGSESYWAGVLGGERLRSAGNAGAGDGGTVDFVRAIRPAA